MYDLSILDPSPIKDWLKTAILLSLFTEKGFWAEGELGSRLSSLDRETLRSENLANAEQYAGESLSWLTEQGYIDDLKILASFQESALILKIDPIGLNLNYDSQTFLN